METKNTALRTQHGNYCVNKDRIVVSSPTGNHVTDLYEQALAATTKLEGINCALFAVAALDPVDDKPGCFRAPPTPPLSTMGR